MKNDEKTCKLLQVFCVIGSDLSSPFLVFLLWFLTVTLFPVFFVRTSHLGIHSTSSTSRNPFRYFGDFNVLFYISINVETENTKYNQRLSQDTGRGDFFILKNKQNPFGDNLPCLYGCTHSSPNSIKGQSETETDYEILIRSE